MSRLPLVQAIGLRRPYDQCHEDYFGRAQVFRVPVWLVALDSDAYDPYGEPAGPAARVEQVAVRYASGVCYARAPGEEFYVRVRA